jgi:hypothetical protein
MSDAREAADPVDIGPADVETGHDGRFSALPLNRD